MGASIIRIHILGGAGSGKSYVASQLSSSFHIPHYDLDDIFWENSVSHYGIKAPEIIRDHKLRNMVMEDSWIIEGVYISWLEPSFSAADKIFVLATPVEIQESRIWDRYHKRSIGIEPNKKKETYVGVVELIKWNRNYNEKKIKHFIEHCRYQEKLVVINDNLKILEMIE